MATELELPRPLPYYEARRVADHLVELLAPACERIEIAGSIRRGRPVASDVELVVVPRLELGRAAGQSTLFDGPPSETVNLVWTRLEEVSEGHERIIPIKPGSPTIEPDPNWYGKRVAGSRYFRLYLPRARTKVDLFLCDRDTWGAIYTIRTGSAAFSRALVARWTVVSHGGHFRDGRLRDSRGRPFETPEEVDVFAACSVAYVAPGNRTGPDDLEALP